MPEPVKCSAVVTRLLADLAPQATVIKRSIFAIAGEYKVVRAPSAEPAELFHTTISEWRYVGSPVLRDRHRRRSGLEVDVLPFKVQQVSHPQPCVEAKDYERGHLPPFLIDDPSYFDKVVDLFGSKIFVGINGLGCLFDASGWRCVGAG